MRFLVDSHLLEGSPRRLLLVSTGTISNRELLALVDVHLTSIVSAAETTDFIELTPGYLLVHQ